MTSGDRFGYLIVLLFWLAFAVWVTWMVRH